MLPTRPDYSRFSLAALRAVSPHTDAAREFTTSLSRLILARLTELPAYDAVDEAVAALRELGHALVAGAVHGEGFSYVEEFDGGSRRFQIVGMKDFVSVSYHAQETEAQRLAYLSAAERAAHQLRQEFYRRAQALWDKDLASLPELQRIILCVDTLEREVNNGGFAQYLANTHGLQVADLVGALQKIGAPRTAALVQQAISVLPGTRADDWHARNQTIATVVTERGDFLSALDAEFARSSEDLALLTMHHVTRQEENA